MKLSRMAGLLIAMSALAGCAGASGDAEQNDDGDATEALVTSGGSLGLLDNPGERLKGKKFKIAKDQSLSFETDENQITCIRTLTVNPTGGATVKEEVVASREEDELGGMTRFKRTLTVPSDARSGSTMTVTAAACFQSRNDPMWNFTFKIVVK